VQKLAPAQQSSSTTDVALAEMHVARPGQNKEAFTPMQSFAQSVPLIQIATVLTIIMVLLAIRKLADVAERAATRARNAKDDTQFDASAKLQQLLTGLRFEPSDSLLPTEMYLVTEHESGNNTEDEPEAEATVAPVMCAMDNGAKPSAQQPEPEPLWQEKAAVCSPIKVPGEVGLKVQVISC
jgi:hypothetical protein